MISVTSRRPSSILVDEALADDVAQGVGQPLPDLLCFIGCEEAEDAIDALAGVDRVQRAEEQGGPSQRR